MGDDTGPACKFGEEAWHDTLVIQQVWGQPLEVIDVDSLPPVAPPAFNFINVLRGREQPLMNIDTAVETVRVVEGAYRSAREGCAVQLA